MKKPMDNGEGATIKNARPGFSRRVFRSAWLAIIVILLTWFVLSLISSRLAWKAVFLDSNQVYFGRFISIPFASTVTVHDTHYLKPDAEKKEGQAASDLVILPVENDIHGPTSKIYINKDHVLYYQKLKPGTTLYKGLEDSLKR